MTVTGGFVWRVVIVLAVLAAGFGLIALVVPESDWLRAAGPVFVLAGAVAGFTVAPQYRRLQALGGDRNGERRLRRAVLQGKPIELDAGERVRASGYALIALEVLPFALLQTLMLLAAVGAFAAVPVDAGDVWSVVFTVLLVTAAAVGIWQIAVLCARFVRARRYLVDEPARVGAEETRS